MAKKNKVYAVKEGRSPGLYFSWDDCKRQVDGHPGAKYKGFATAEEAYGYLQEPEDEAVAIASQAKAVPGVPSGPYAFVDGSFNEATGTYGYGGFLDVGGRRYPLMGAGSDPAMVSMRNVAGEIEGSMAAVRKAEELHLREMAILYDYMGIEQWATGKWSANKPGTVAYRDFMDPSVRTVSVSFIKVAGHTGVEGNEMADVMAKFAVGIKLTAKQQALLDRALSAGNRDGSDVPWDEGPDCGMEVEA